MRLADLGRCRGLSPYRLTPEGLPDLCVLSGCDYLPSLPKVGLKTAALLLHRSGGSLERALQLARRDGVPVPTDYAQRLAEARLVFTSQAVFDPVEGRLRPLRTLPDGLGADENMFLVRHLGLGLSDELARGVAEGLVNPLTLLPFEKPDAAEGSVSQRGCAGNREPRPRVSATGPSASQRSSPSQSLTHFQEVPGGTELGAGLDGTPLTTPRRPHTISGSPGSHVASDRASQRFRPPRPSAPKSGSGASWPSVAVTGASPASSPPKRRRLGCRLACTIR